MDTPIPDPADTDEPTTLVNVLALFTPMCTLPVIAPRLIKVLPAEVPNPTRPVMVPALLALTRAPP